MSDCTLDNPLDQLFCEVCGQKRPDDHNGVEDKNIEEKFNDVENNNQTWKCDNCTIKNDVQFTVCQICDRKRVSSLPQKVDNNNSNEINHNNNNDNDTWKCSQCTFENESSSIKCAMCDAINQNKTKNVKLEYCWEWKGGKNWHEYPSDISDKIEKAYFSGELKIDLDLPHAKYIIDLTKLQQINTNSQKARPIQRVEYQYNNNNKNDDVMDVDQDEIDEKSQELPSSLITDTKKTDNNDNDMWNCSYCTFENHVDSARCQVCQNKRTSAKSAPSNGHNVDIDIDMQNGTKLMELSSDDESSKKHKKKKTTRKNKKKQTTKDDDKNGTLLAIFEKEKNDKDVPAPLPKLKGRKKRKLSEILNEDEVKDQNRNKPKRQKVKISTKYQGKYSGTSMGAELNKDLIDKLWELSMIERNSGNKFKANAYSKACKALKTINKKITSGKEAQQLNGVGKKIAAKIDEILSTGHLVKLDKLRADDTIQAINELCQIHGIGPKKAAELVKENKIFTIEQLRKHQNLLNNQQKIGLKYFEHINKRIPREQCTAIGEIVKKELNSIDKNIIMDICGSYRRGKKDCGDVDILLTHPDTKYNNKKQGKQLLNKIVIKLKECKLLIEDLAHGPVKYMGICRFEEITDDIDDDDDELPDSVPTDFTFNIPDINDDDDTRMITLNVGSDNHNNKIIKKKVGA